MRRSPHFIPLVISLLIAASLPEARARVLEVGPGRMYTLPSQAATAVRDGDTVAIDAGSYVDCATWTRNDLLIRGIGGYAHVRDKSCGGKAIWVIRGNNTTIESIEFSGASVVDGNGAGIRQEGANLTVRRCYFTTARRGFLPETTRAVKS